MNSVILSLLLFLLLFGAAVVLWLKRITMITEKNSPTGGNHNGKQLLNSHQKELSLTIMFLILEMKMGEYNHASLKNGQTLWKMLTSIQQEVMSWVTLQSQQSKPSLQNIS